HASHHVWITLPDPHPRSFAQRFTGAPRCSARFADVPLWPHTGDPSLIVENVVGQLLFAHRFGTTASCNDYTLHWDAAPDTCRRLIADPVGVLADAGALAEVRAVLDRRRRQVELGKGSPPVSAVVSLQCLVVDRAALPTGTTVQLDGETIAVREIRVAPI